MLVDPAFHPLLSLPVVVVTESGSDHGKLRRGEVAAVDISREDSLCRVRGAAGRHHTFNP